MSRFTKEARQKIVRDFAEQNGGWFDPAAFLAHVQAAGPGHPAFTWFQWEDEKAAHEHRLDQSRDFARGLVVRFEVRKVERGKMSVVTQTAPLIISPERGRREGGGYFLTDPNDPEHLAEHCRQAAQSMRWFISRYEAAISFAGGDLKALQRIQAQLENASSAATMPVAAE